MSIHKVMMFVAYSLLLLVVILAWLDYNRTFNIAISILVIVFSIISLYVKKIGK